MCTRRQLGLWWITISDSSAKFKTFIWHGLLEKMLPISTMGISKLLQENYQRYPSPSAFNRSQFKDHVFDWIVIEFHWMFISNHCFKRKTETPCIETSSNNFQSLVTPFLGTKYFFRAHWPLWLPEKLYLPFTICGAFLSHFGGQTVVFSAPGTAKHVHTILQVWSLGRNIASRKPMASSYLEADVFLGWTGIHSTK